MEQRLACPALFERAHYRRGLHEIRPGPDDMEYMHGNNLAGMILKEHANQTHTTAAFRTQANIELMAEVDTHPVNSAQSQKSAAVRRNEVSPAQRPQVWRNKQHLSEPSRNPALSGAFLRLLTLPYGSASCSTA
jgi:hypothetical protein